MSLLVRTRKSLERYRMVKIFALGRERDSVQKNGHEAGHGHGKKFSKRKIFILNLITDDVVCGVTKKLCFEKLNY